MAAEIDTHPLDPELPLTLAVLFGMATVMRCGTDDYSRHIEVRRRRGRMTNHDRPSSQHCGALRSVDVPMSGDFRAGVRRARCKRFAGRSPRCDSDGMQRWT